MYPAPILILRTFEALTFWTVHYYLKLLSILKNDRNQRHFPKLIEVNARLIFLSKKLKNRNYSTRLLHHVLDFAMYHGR